MHACVDLYLCKSLTLCMSLALVDSRRAMYVCVSPGVSRSLSRQAWHVCMYLSLTHCMLYA
jgi:hypothetical protein